MNWSRVHQEDEAVCTRTASGPDAKVEVKASATRLASQPSGSDSRKLNCFEFCLGFSQYKSIRPHGDVSACRVQMWYPCDMHTCILCVYMCFVYY